MVIALLSQSKSQQFSAPPRPVPSSFATWAPPAPATRDGMGQRHVQLEGKWGHSDRVT